MGLSFPRGKIMAIEWVLLWLPIAELVLFNPTGEGPETEPSRAAVPASEPTPVVIDRSGPTRRHP